MVVIDEMCTDQIVQLWMQLIYLLTQSRQAERLIRLGTCEQDRWSVSLTLSV